MLRWGFLPYLASPLYLQKIEYVVEVQKYWRNELGTPPLTWVTVTMLCDIFLI
jgi:hypothetical protein